MHMDYHVSKGGVNLGKFSVTDITRNLASGTFSLEDHYWAVGMPGWKPLSQFNPEAKPGSIAQAAPRSASTPRSQQSAGQQAYGGHHSHTPYPTPAPDNSAQTFAYIGGGMLALGVFGPVMQMGRLAFSMIENGNSKGITILCLGIAGAVLSSFRLFVFIWVPAVIAALILGDICIHIADAPSTNLLGTRITLAPGWGLFVMVAGNAFLIASAWVGSRKRQP